MTWAWDLVPSWIYGEGAPDGSIHTMNLTAVRGALDQLLFCAETLAKASPHNAIPDTLNFDLVNLGRELLAQLSSLSILNLTNAVSNQDRETALRSGGLLMEIFADLDELLACGALLSRAPTVCTAASSPELQLTDHGPVFGREGLSARAVDCSRQGMGKHLFTVRRIERLLRVAGQVAGEARALRPRTVAQEGGVAHCCRLALVIRSAVCLECAQVSTWQPISAAQAKEPATYTHLQGLDTYAGKQWSGLVRDFYGAVARECSRSRSDRFGCIRLRTLSRCSATC